MEGDMGTEGRVFLAAPRHAFGVTLPIGIGRRRAPSKKSHTLALPLPKASEAKVLRNTTGIHWPARRLPKHPRTKEISRK